MNNAWITPLLLCAHRVGTASCSKIERACHEDLAFRVLTGTRKPDRSRISEFRRTNLDAPKGLVVQIHGLIQKARMVSLGNFAPVGAKARANPYSPNAIGHGRILRAEKELEKEINTLMRRKKFWVSSKVAAEARGGCGFPRLQESQARIRSPAASKALVT